VDCLTEYLQKLGVETLDADISDIDLIFTGLSEQEKEIALLLNEISQAMLNL